MENSLINKIISKFSLDKSNKLLVDGQPIGANVDLSQYPTLIQVQNLLLNKVDKDGVKQLSTEDYTTIEKTKLASINVTELTDAYNHITNLNNPHSTKITNLADTNIITPTNGQVLGYDVATSKWINISVSANDEKVKASATGTSQYLDTIVDGTTCNIESNKLVVKSLQGMNVSIAEINTLQGMDTNVKTLFNTLASAGMTYTGIVGTKALLNAVTGMTTGNVKIVLVDETQTNKRMAYIYSGTTWESVGEANITQRNFQTDPIKLGGVDKEIVGVLEQANMDLTGIVKTSDLADYTKTTDLEANYAKKSDLTAKLNITDIVDDLISTDINKPLSANQGKVLNDTKTQINDSATTSIKDTYSIDKILTLLADKQNKITISITAPTTPNTNDIFIDTTAIPYIMKVYNGSQWIQVGSSSSGNGVLVWTLGDDYKANSLVVFNSNLYLTLNDITNSVNNPSVDSVNFEAIGGESNTFNNLGSGVGIYTQTVGNDVQFKSVKAGSNVTLVSSGDSVTINATVTGNADYTTNYNSTNLSSFSYDNTKVAFDSTGGKLYSNTLVDSQAKLVMHMENLTKDDLGHTITNVGATIDTTNYKIGTSSASFNGTSNYISIAKSSDFNIGTNDFTISFYVKTTTYVNSGYFRRFFTLGGTDSTNTIQLLFYGSDKITVYSNAVAIAGATSIANGAWHHIELSRASGTLRLFVDGVLDGSVAFTNSLTAGATYNPAIGCYGDFTGGYFQGNIDEFILLNGKALHTTNFTPPITQYGLNYDTTGYNKISQSSTSLVDANDIYQVNSITINQNTPTNTDIKWALDIGTTYPKIWDSGSSSWIDCTNIATQGMSYTTFQTALTNCKTNYAWSKLGFVCALHSGENFTTPTVSSVAVSIMKLQNKLQGHIIEDSTSSFLQRGNLKFTGDLKVTDDPTNNVTTINVDASSKISNPNLLINADFSKPINQRGLNSYTTSGYTIDRWYAYSGNLTVNSGYVTFTGNYLSQRLEFPTRFSGKTVTFSACVKGKGNLKMYSAELLSDTDYVSFDNTDWVIVQKTITLGTYTDDTKILQVSISNSASTNIKWVKLELGSIATPFYPRLYGEELALCKRYYQNFKDMAFNASCSQVNAINANIIYPVEMRDSPKVNIYSYNGTLGKINPSDSVTTLVSVSSLFANTNKGFCQIVTSEAVTANKYYTYKFDADAEIY